MSESLAALMAVLALATGQEPVQDPQSPPTQLEDVEVTARANADMARTFVVGEVPPRVRSRSTAW